MLQGKGFFGYTMISDDQGRIANFYVCSSCVYLSLFTAILFYTKSYLYFGNDKFIFVYFLFILIEVSKYVYIFIVDQKVFSYNLKHKSKLMNILELLGKQFKIGELARCLLVIFLSTFGFSIVAILFGAEFLDHHIETLMFGGLMSTLTIFPSYLHLGLNSLLLLFHGVKPNNEFSEVIWRSIQLTILGAWLGAFLIPLDWDCEWQVWPVPCSCGAFLGYVISYFISYLLISVKLYESKIIKSGCKNR
uniref:Phosphatidylinositol-glycan biosynthesis class F protein n=1 Tax=Clastoptera arizonana TaxID=38151 RepID=A0A1B6D6I1_9HEMI